MRASRLGAWCVCFWGASAVAAFAQTPVPPAARVEIAAGLLVSSHIALGAQAAAENAVSGSFALFSTKTSLDSNVQFGARLDVRILSSLDAEASGSYGHPPLTIGISGDTEGAPDTSASETLTQVTVSGGVRWRPARLRVGNLSPFVSAGFGYLRELHEGETVVTEGQTAHAGGGVGLPLLSRSGKLKAAGMRMEALAVARRRGAAIDDRTHIGAAALLSMFVSF